MLFSALDSLSRQLRTHPTGLSQCCTLFDKYRYCLPLTTYDLPLTTYDLPLMTYNFLKP